VFDFGAVTGATTITETVADNIVFVVTFVSLSLFGDPDEYAQVALGNGVVCQVVIPHDDTSGAPAFESVVCDVALEQESAVNIVNASTAGTASWVIAGYTWAHL
jgi:hypothetical protein